MVEESKTQPIDHGFISAGGTVVRETGSATVQGAKAGGGFLGAVGKFLGGFGGGTVGGVVGAITGLIVTALFISTGGLALLIGVGVGAAILGFTGLAVGGAVGKGVGYVAGAPIGAVPGAAVGLVKGAGKVVNEKTEAKRRVNTVPLHEEGYVTQTYTDAATQQSFEPQPVINAKTNYNFQENEAGPGLQAKLDQIIASRAAANTAEARVEQSRQTAAAALAER